MRTLRLHDLVKDCIHDLFRLQQGVKKVTLRLVGRNLVDERGCDEDGIDNTVRGGIGSVKNISTAGNFEGGVWDILT